MEGGGRSQSSTFHMVCLCMVTVTFPSQDATTRNVAFSYLGKCKTWGKWERDRVKVPGPKYFLSFCLFYIHLPIHLTTPIGPKLECFRQVCSRSESNVRFLGHA